jgi:hypothetical protein
MRRRTDVVRIHPEVGRAADADGDPGGVVVLVRLRDLPLRVDHGDELSIARGEPRIPDDGDLLPLVHRERVDRPLVDDLPRGRVAVVQTYLRAGCDAHAADVLHGERDDRGVSRGHHLRRDGDRSRNDREIRQGGRRPDAREPIDEL